MKRVGKTTSKFMIMTEIKLETVIENGVIKVKKITIVVKSQGESGCSRSPLVDVVVEKIHLNGRKSRGKGAKKRRNSGLLGVRWACF